MALPKSAMAATATSGEVLALVSPSSQISSLTNNQIHGLDASMKDLPWRIYGATPGKLGCATLSTCTFGPKASKKSLVILGDSHAMMWIPAILPNAIKLGYKISLVWEPACPIASLSVPALFPPDFRPNTRASWLSSTLTAVAHAAPQAIILGERSARVIAQGGTVPFSSASWQAGLQTTIAALKGAHTKIALLGDTPYSSQQPASCLAIHPKAVQSCGVANPSPDYPGQQIAEQAAASATG
ncbi:MAG: SGNH hydrolase domain-containing protein, partial [Actinomycetota bacterium]